MDGLPFAEVDAAAASGEVVGEEGGEPIAPTAPPAPTPPTPGGGTTDSNPETSVTTGQMVTGTDSLTLEITLLSLDAVDRVAGGIAQRVSAAMAGGKLKGVVLADPAAVNAMRLRTLLMGEIESLELTVASAQGASEGVEGAAAAFGVTDALGVVKKSAHMLATTLSWFEVSSDYKGKGSLVQAPALAAALAKHLTAQGIEARVPRYAIAPLAQGGLIGRALAVQQKCREMSFAGQGGPTIDSVNQVVSSLLQALFGASVTGEAPTAVSNSLAQQLAEADVTAAALEKGFGLLTVELAIAAGSYRAKKWILNALLGRDGLTYNGGAAATFFLLAGDRMAALASDTIYFATGHGQFQGPPTHFRSTNI